MNRKKNPPTPKERHAPAPSEKRSGMGRRDFLRILGVTSAGAAAVGCGLNSQPVAEKRERAWKNLKEEWATTACTFCPGGCGLKVRVVDGVAVKIEGNPRHPVNEGGLCPQAVSGLQVHYHPKRVKTPLKQIGPRGSRQWKAVSWEEALAEWSERLRKMRAEGGAHQLLVLDGAPQEGLLSRLWQRFCRAYGTPNHVAASFALPTAHLKLTQGLDKAVGYDWENAGYVLSFGHNWLDGGESPVRAHRAYGHLRQRRGEGKVKIVHAESRLSVSASMADEWIPVRPGTEGALALGIAYVILKEERYDSSFLNDFAFGLESWRDAHSENHAGFREYVLSRYRPEAVADATGVPVDVIVRLAKEFSRVRPAVAVAGEGALLHSNGTFAGMAVHALNALVGSIETPGGVRLARDLPLAPWPDVSLDKEARAALAQPRLDEAGSESFPFARSVPDVIPEKVALAQPYGVEMLVVSEANPAHEAVAPARFEAVLKKIPYVVCLSTFLDETAELADLVLPASSPLERWQDAPAPASTSMEAWSVAKPAVAVRGEARHPGDVLMEVSRRMEGSVAGAFPWHDFAGILEESARGLFEARRGTLFSERHEEEHVARLEERGWWHPAHETFEAFWDDLLQKGGWWDPYYPERNWGRALRTPSGKFEFFSRTLHERTKETARTRFGGSMEKTLRAWRVQASGDEAFMPHHEPPRVLGEKSAYPAAFGAFEMLPLRGGRGAERSLLQETLAPHVKARWDSWVEVHPRDAEAWGLREDALAWVESPAGKALARVKIFPGMMPGCVGMPLGLGRTAGCGMAEGRGANPLTLLAVEMDGLSGAASRHSVLVKVYPA